MKKLIIIALFFPNVLFAKVLFHCSTPTTVVSVSIQDSSLITRFTHPYGVEFTPFFKGAVSSFQIKDLIDAQQLHQTLGNVQEIQWPLDQCTINPPFLVSCRQGSVAYPPSDFPMRPLSIETSLNRVSTAQNQYEVFNIRLALLEGPNLRYLTSDYSLSLHCFGP